MIIFAADVHLTKRVWKARRDLDGDSFRAFSDFQDQVLELNKVEPVSVILGGDVFDDNAVKGAPLEAFADFVDALFEEGVPVYTIQGNHDQDPDVPIAQVQGSQTLHRVMVRIDGRMVSGLDWMTREELQEELKTTPKEVEILVLHGMAEHLMGFEAAADFSMEDVRPTVKHVVVGDIHVNDVTTIDGTTCVSPGALHPTSIMQEGPYGFYAMAKGSDTWERHDIPGREIRRFALMSDTDAASIEAALPTIQTLGTGDLAPLVEVKYVSEYSETIERWESQFPGIRFFTKPSAKGKILSKEDLEEAQENFQELSLVNSLSMVVEPTKDKELFDFIHSCLQGDALRLVEKQVEPFTCNPSA